MTQLSFEDVRFKHRGLVIQPKEELYELLVHRWSPNEEGRPQVIFQPVCETDVSLAVSYAVSNGLDVAVANGGHSFLGASSTSGGLQVDMRRMRAAWVQNDKYGSDGILTIEGGALVSDVAAACEKRGTYVTLPSHKEIGYSGFTLGGGCGWGLGHQGMSIDLLVAARVALASGHVVTASERENPDLFWALKGAGYNFGVVTSMTFKVQGLTTRVFSGSIVYPPSSYREVFLAAEKYVAQQQDNDMISFVLTPYFSGAPVQEALIAIPYYHGDDEQEAHRRFKMFLDIPHIEAKVGLMWFHQTADLFPEALWPRTNRLSNGSVCTRLSPDIWLPVVESLRKWWEADPSRKTGTQFFLGLYNWRKTLVGGEPSSAWPPNRGPPNDSGNTGSSWRDFAVYIGYDNLEDAEAARVYALQVVKDLRDSHAEFVGHDVIEDIVYPNAGAMRGFTGEYIYKGNYPRLQTIKAKYDPGNIFNKKHPIEPKH